MGKAADEVGRVPWPFPEVRGRERGGVGRAAEEVVGRMWRRLTFRTRIAGSSADAVLEGGQVRAKTGPKPRESHARDARERRFFRIDRGDGGAKDAIRRVRSHSVVYNFGMDFAESTPVVHRGDKTRGANKLLDG